MGDDKVYGTASRDAPVSRVDFERAIRNLNMSDLDLRDAVIQLAARVITLTDELTRRIDGVEPQPAPPNTPAPAPAGTVEAMVSSSLGETLEKIRAADVAGMPRVHLDDSGEDKYEVEPFEIPCHELIPLCGAKCCTLTFPLSTADLDEGIVRWDYGQPYLIAQRASDGYCVHNDPDSRGCTVHHHRPRVCRKYDCRKDTRIWVDYDQRIATPPGRVPLNAPQQPDPVFDLIARAKRRSVAVHAETVAINETYAELEPVLGPVPPKP